MKYTTAILASATGASALTQMCSSGSPRDEGGNWFCGAVNHILYQGIVGQGSYDSVSHMTQTGECKKEKKPYGGPLAPLDEDLSIHIRGPISFRQAAVYNLVTKKRDTHAHGHAHGHAHNHAAFHHNADRAHEARDSEHLSPQRIPDSQNEKRGDWVTATINGDVVSWENTWHGPPTVSPAAPAPAATSASSPVAPAANAQAQAPKDDSHTKVEIPPSQHSSGDWSRVAYYNAGQKVVDNMVFLGNYGGQGSGVWDPTWGSSLAYLNAEGNGGSSSSQILNDVFLPSNKEFAIYSGEKCDDSCGFSRASDVAYKGFAGGNKVFLFEFKMPLDGDRGFNGDMPALWLLNGRIARTAQYSFCSCWDTGCGECDIYEVLAKGDTKCKSTFHLANGAGSSDYFDRPVDKYVKVAAVFHEQSASVSIKKLPDSTDFSEGLDDATVRSWLNSETDGGLSSLFQLRG